MSWNCFWKKTFAANTLFWGTCNWWSERLALFNVLRCFLLSIEALVRNEKKTSNHTKKGIVQCESCVYYIAVMSSLNYFLIVCFYATIVFPCLSFSLCVCSVSEPMQLAIYFCQARIVVEQGWLSGEDLCTCIAWFLVLKRCQKHFIIFCQVFGFRTCSWQQTTMVRTAQRSRLHILRGRCPSLSCLKKDKILEALVHGGVV